MTDTSNIPIKASQLGALPSNNPNLSKDLDGHGYDIVTPTALELRAAPTGKLTVHGVVLGAICVPSPEAVVKNGRVVTPSGLTPITAGPSAVFSFTAPSSATVAPTGANTPRLYDQGANSCSSFE
jgi:hypothetical protein